MFDVTIANSHKVKIVVTIECDIVCLCSFVITATISDEYDIRRSEKKLLEQCGDILCFWCGRAYDFGKKRGDSKIFAK